METDEQSCVLVTGGRGFIGRALREALRGAGNRVISVDVAPAETALNTSREDVVSDICGVVQMQRIFERQHVDRVVHLAAILPTAAQRSPEFATQVNIHGTLSLLELAKQFGVRRFVFGSSLSIYGTYPEDHAVTEMDRAAPEDLYGAAKLYVEQLGQAYRHVHGLEFVSLRIGRVVGPGARSATSAWRSEIFERLGTASAAEIEIPYGDSERVLLVHVEDVAKMLLQLLQAPRTAHCVYNAACESVIVGELKSEIERLNPRLRVKLGGQAVVGNPRQVEWSRFAGEFGLGMVPIFEQLASAAGEHG